MLSPILKPAAVRLGHSVGRAPAAVLGLFIVWQLVFLVLANLLEFIPHRARRLDEFTGYRERPAELVNAKPAVHVLAAVADCWAQLTGQYQMWWLFAPNFPPQATFPVVELRWDDPAAGSAPVRLLSSLEPANTASYFRPPTSADRLLHYEMNLCLGLMYWDEPTDPAEVEMWKKLLGDIVRCQWKSIRAYLRWRTNEYLADHPDLPPPDEARLLVRIYPTPPAGAAPADRQPPYDQPFARWRCAEDGPSTFLPVEGYEPFAGRYIPLPYPPGKAPRAEVVRHD